MSADAWTYKVSKNGGVAFFFKITECVARENVDKVANVKRSIAFVADLIISKIDEEYAFGFAKQAAHAILDLVLVVSSGSWTYKIDEIGGVSFAKDGRVSNGCVPSASESVVNNIRRSISYVADLINGEDMEFVHCAAHAIIEMCSGHV